MSLLASYAVAIIIEGVLYSVFGASDVQLHAWYVTSSVKIFGFYLADIYLLGFGLAVLLVIALYFMLYRTTFGRSVRATMQDRTAARLVGIDVNRVAALTFGIGVAVTAVGGMVYGTVNAFNPNSGYDLISRLLAIIILGGLGSIAGALAAAVFMITLESVVNVLWSPSWAIVVFYARARARAQRPPGRHLRAAGSEGAVTHAEPPCSPVSRRAGACPPSARCWPSPSCLPAGGHQRRGHHVSPSTR